MKALERQDRVVLPDLRIAVCGDWHGSISWARTIAKAMPAIAPDVSTVMHLGDWGMTPEAVDDAFSRTGIDRIYVTLGNDEQWSQISPLLDKKPGMAVRVSDIVWFLPRPARLSIGGRNVLSLGGAASLDRASREEGLTWWPDEAITDAHVSAATAGGPADVMFAHESPAGTPVRTVREVLRSNLHGFPPAALEASAASRARITKVWNAVHPELLVHGHMHIAGGGWADDGRRVSSLGRDGAEGNLGILDMRTLRMETPSLRVIRTLAAQSEDRRVERERRMHSVAEALHSGVLDGRRPSSAAIQDAWSYIDGRRTLDDIIEDVRRRHTRHRDDHS